jgi:hypothetical protein
MTARIRWGLIAGVVGLFVNTLASLVFAFCGPIVSFGIGIVAGLIVTQREPATSKGEGAQGGAITGLIAGAFILLGQIIGAIGNLVFAQMVEYESIFGTLPDLSSPEGQTLYWVIGIGVGLCFGLVDTLACVLGGALIGYIRTPAPADQHQEIV